jgi:hypothetical protein
LGGTRLPRQGVRSIADPLRRQCSAIRRRRAPRNFAGWDIRIFWSSTRATEKNLRIVIVSVSQPCAPRPSQKNK